MKDSIFILISLYLIYISYIDIKTCTLRNKILTPLVILCLVNLFTSLEQVVNLLLGSFVGGGCILLVTLVVSSLSGREGIGGGDINLIAILGAFLGLERTLVCIVILFISAGFISILILMLNKVLKRNVNELPLAPSITLGFILASFV